MISLIVLSISAAEIPDTKKLVKESSRRPIVMLSCQNEKTKLTTIKVDEEGIVRFSSLLTTVELKS